MLKKLILILSISAFSAQCDLNAGQEGQFGKIRSKLYGLCWKTSPRKAITLISAFMAVYTSWSLIISKVNRLSFLDTFIKTGTHPWEMLKLNGLYNEAIFNLIWFDEKAHKADDTFWKAKIACFKAREAFLEILDQTDKDKIHPPMYKCSIFFNYSNVDFNDLAKLALNNKYKEKEQAKEFYKKYLELTTAWVNFEPHIKDYEAQKRKVEEMPWKPNLCAPSEDEELA